MIIRVFRGQNVTVVSFSCSGGKWRNRHRLLRLDGASRVSGLELRGETLGLTRLVKSGNGGVLCVVTLMKA